jgi:hypothetical protein
MDLFFNFLKLGFQHITDLNGYDHMLFILALCAPLSLENWSKALVLISCFTLGHSLSLALAVLKIVQIDSALVEFLIPISIILTCIYNLNESKFLTKSSFKRSMVVQALIVTFFGLIHGLGFSNYLKSLMGKSDAIWKELLAFNLGLEIGQILSICIFFLIITLFLNNLKVRKAYLCVGLSCLVIGLTLPILFEKWIF